MSDADWFYLLRHHDIMIELCSGQGRVSMDPVSNCSCGNYNRVAISLEKESVVIIALRPQEYSRSPKSIPRGPAERSWRCLPIVERTTNDLADSFEGGGTTADSWRLDFRCR